MSISSVSADPLFSSVVTIYLLILLYSPSPFAGIVLSPVLISTSVILLSLLRLGAIQKKNRRRKEPEPVSDGNADSVSDEFMIWDRLSSWEDRDPGVGAPLEVIHEGPETDEVSVSDSKMSAFMSLSEVYPESDSDSDISSEDFPATDGMIEIELDGKKTAAEYSSDIDEEDNLIEIDLNLSVAR